MKPWNLEHPVFAIAKHSHDTVRSGLGGQKLPVLSRVRNFLQRPHVRKVGLLGSMPVQDGISGLSADFVSQTFQLLLENLVGFDRRIINVPISWMAVVSSERADKVI